MWHENKPLEKNPVAAGGRGGGRDWGLYLYRKLLVMKGTNLGKLSAGCFKCMTHFLLQAVAGFPQYQCHLAGDLKGSSQGARLGWPELKNMNSWERASVLSWPLVCLPAAELLTWGGATHLKNSKSCSKLRVSLNNRDRSNDFGSERRNQRPTLKGRRKEVYKGWLSAVCRTTQLRSSKCQVVQIRWSSGRRKENTEWNKGVVLC